jgi:hypothetical protein
MRLNQIRICMYNPCLQLQPTTACMLHRRILHQVLKSAPAPPTTGRRSGMGNAALGHKFASHLIWCSAMTIVARRVTHRRKNGNRETYSGHHNQVQFSLVASRRTRTVCAWMTDFWYHRSHILPRFPSPFSKSPDTDAAEVVDRILPPADPISVIVGNS